MLGIILGLILLAAGTAVIVGLGVKWKKAEGEAGSIRLGFILGGVLLLLVAVSSCAGIKQMDAQQYGVVTRFGAPTGRVLTPKARMSPRTTRTRSRTSGASRARVCLKTSSIGAE